MQIKYKNEDPGVEIKDLGYGDIFLWEENAWIILNCLHCESVAEREDVYLCAKLSNGFVRSFPETYRVIPKIQSLLEVKS